MRLLATTSTLILVAMTSIAAAQGTGQDSPADRKDPGSLSAGQKQVTPSTRDRGENAPGTSSSGTSAGEEGAAPPGANPTNEPMPGTKKGMGTAPGPQ